MKDATNDAAKLATWAGVISKKIVLVNPNLIIAVL
jgi:hypothetical protein